MKAGARIHGSCVARDGAGVLLLGPSGAGKSDLALRLVGRGFMLVADDQVDVFDGFARAPDALVGLLEVRGLGIMRLPHLREARLRVVVEMTDRNERLPRPERHADLDLPLVRLNAFEVSAPDRVSLALDCALGLVSQHTGAFAL